MTDVLSRAEIDVVVRKFYSKAIADETIGHFFEGLDLEAHLPTIGDFWDNMVFRSGKYQGGMMYKHFQLNAKHTMEKEHFYRWLDLFTKTIEENYQGPNAEGMKNSALSLARTIYGRIEEQKAFPFAVKDAPK